MARWAQRGALTVLAAALLGGGCGEGSGPTRDGVETSPEKPEALSATEAAAATEPEKPETLRLLDDGNPTVYLRLGETADLFDKPEGKVVETVRHTTEFGSRTVYAVTEQKGDWVAVLTPHTENGEPLWLELDPERLRAGTSVWNLEVDLSEFETRLFKEGELVKTFPVSVGMPTAPTPTGRFAITDTFRGDLNEAYGCCALATTARQVNLPSGWLGGDRIAFHGTDGEIGAAISHGCVRAADADVSALVDTVPLGTPVEIHR